MDSKCDHLRILFTSQTLRDGEDWCDAPETGEPDVVSQKAAVIYTSEFKQFCVYESSSLTRLNSSAFLEHFKIC